MRGAAVTTERLPLVRPALPSREQMDPILAEIWGSGIVTTGPYVRRFEEAVEQAVGVEHAVMMSHGTTALMLAIRALGLEEGEVIVPSFSWTATAGAVVWNGMTPIFADITPGRLTMDPAAAEAAITERTRAIMAVNVFGVPADYEALEAVAERHGVLMVYDTAQGLGSEYRGRPAGGFGVAECFSMSPTKVVTAMEGGLVTTDDAGLAEALRSMRDSGKDATGDIARLGLSGRPSEVHGAVAWLNFERRRELIAERHRLIGGYRRRLEGIPGLSFQVEPPDTRSSGNYFVVFVDGGGRAGPRDALYRALAEEGIQTKKYFHPAIHLQGAYAYLSERYRGRLPVTERASAEGLALPLFDGMTEADLDRVAAAVRRSVSPEIRPG